MPSVLAKEIQTHMVKKKGILIPMFTELSKKENYLIFGSFENEQQKLTRNRKLTKLIF